MILQTDYYSINLNVQMNIWYMKSVKHKKQHNAFNQREINVNSIMTVFNEPTSEHMCTPQQKRGEQVYSAPPS